MTCMANSRSLSKLLDGEITASERVAIEEHLSNCEDCRNTLKAWQAQGEVLRALLGRHSLSEGFVQKVSLANRANAPAKRKRKDLYAWLQAAAAVLIVIFLLSQLFSSGDSLTLAQVINAGNRLEVRSSNSRSWEPTSIGAMLRKGDWIRNWEPSAAQLQLNDSSRITLQEGALMQLHGRVQNLRNQVVLLQGSMQSQVSDGTPGVEIRTPAGDITALKTRFGVEVRNVTLPTLELTANRSEILKGSVVAMAGVTVDEGMVGVATGKIRRVLAGGEAALFTSSLFAKTPVFPAQAEAVDASLQVVTGPSLGNTALLSSSLISTDRGLQVKVEADGVPLTRLLDWAVGTKVRGGEDLRVSGILNYPPDVSQGDVLAGIANSLGLELSFRQEVTRQQTAYLPETAPPSPEERSNQNFVVSKSPEGLLSFEFHGVAAGEVFRSLRAEKVELPYLAAQSKSVPLTLQAKDLTPVEVSSWLGRRLGFTVRETDQTIGVVDIRPAHYEGTDRTVIHNPVEQKAQSYSDSASTNPVIAFDRDIGSEDEMRPAGPAARNGPRFVSTYSNAVSTPTRLRASYSGVWNVLPERKSPAPQQKTKDVTGSPGDKGATMTSKVAAKSKAIGTEEMTMLKFSQGSRHLIWPVVVAGDAAVADDIYQLYNLSNYPVNTTWSAYDSAGHMMARFEVEVDRSSAIALLPVTDFGVWIEDGGHWETTSNSSLLGTAITGGGLGVVPYAAAGFDHLPSSWGFVTAQLAGMGGSNNLWLINPSEETTRVILAVVEKERPVLSQAILMAPHSGMIWSAESLLPAYPEIGRLGSGALVVVQSKNGYLAAGIRSARKPVNP